MKLLSSLARALVRKDFVESLRNASVGRRGRRPRRRRGQPRARRRPRPAPAAAPVEKPPPRHWSRSPRARPASRTPTWPPTRWPPRPRRPASPCIVETQGSSGSTPLSAETIANADAVIFATDVGRQGPGPVRRQAGRSPPASSGRSTSPPRWSPKPLPQLTIRTLPRVEGSAGGAAASSRTGRRRRLGHPHPADPAHRRELHDPVRRRGRSADRAGLPVRRLRDREQARRCDRSRSATSSR